MSEPKLIIYLLFIFCTAILCGQTNYDVQWRMGQRANIALCFEENELRVESLAALDSFDFGGTVACISDDSGVFQFYSNGCDIYSGNNTPMENGDMTSPGVVEDVFCSVVGDNPIPQGGLILPIPSKNNEYYVLNYDLQLVNYFDTLEAWDPQNLLLHKVDMNLNNGDGTVVSKNEAIIHDDLALARGQLQAVKHANGIDWWVIVPKAASNCYHLILLDEDGVREEKTICSGEPWNAFGGVGQAVFSPDGTRYVRANPWNGINIFDFDRCNGELSNPIVFPFAESGFQGAGVAISPNGNLLYVTRLDKIFQFDLLSEDVENSKILIDTLGPNLPSFAASMFLCQLAPDDKIYIGGTGSHSFLHVINSPNERGLACDFRENGIVLPDLNFVGIPNFPNYDLGASSDYCEPLSTSIFESSLVTGHLEISPNPAKESVLLYAGGETISSYSIYSIHGAELISAEVQGYKQNVDISALPSGAYIVLARLSNGYQQVGKLVKE